MAIRLVGTGACWEFAGGLAAKRNTQLDGLRALAVLGVMWFHWVPKQYQGGLPFEIGLFYFLTLSGFLITRILLRDRAAGEAAGGGWRAGAYGSYAVRRLGRITVPCYVAMLFAIWVGASDIRENPLPYFAHYSNFHMAVMDGWPFGTAHYWTLALQMQFYLLWPLLVFGLPKRWLGPAFAFCVMAAPVSRWVLAQWFPEVRHSEAVTSSALDYFGCGALLALAMERGMRAGNQGLARLARAAFVGYAVLYVADQTGHRVAGLCHVQQTLLAVVFAGLISAALAGIGGCVGRLLERPAIQQVGKVSFGLYLFHTCVPLFLGQYASWLWDEKVGGPWVVLRYAAFALVSWGLAWLCWRWLEGPDRLRFPRLAGAAKR